MDVKIPRATSGTSTGIVILVVMCPRTMERFLLDNGFT